MASSIVALVTLLFVGVIFAQKDAKPQYDDELKAILKIIEHDDFSNITTTGNHNAERTKRSLGYYGGGGCGAYPAAGTSFLGCFNPGRAVVQNNHIVQNYYRTGGYGNCLNYFNALPLSGVAPVAAVAGGYTGQLVTSRQSYTVSACRSCYGGSPGIGITCNNAPYNFLTRQCVFRPTVNNINVNNFNGGGFGGGFGGVGYAAPAVAAVGYAGGYAGGYNGCSGTGCGYGAPAVAVAYDNGCSGAGCGGIGYGAPAVAVGGYSAVSAPVAVAYDNGCSGAGCGGGCFGSTC